MSTGRGGSKVPKLMFQRSSRVFSRDWHAFFELSIFGEGRFLNDLEGGGILVDRSLVQRILEEVTTAAHHRDFGVFRPIQNSVDLRK